MQEFLQQFKTNNAVKYGVFAAWVFIAYVFAGDRQIFGLIMAAGGIALGLFSHNDQVDTTGV